MPAYFPMPFVCLEKVEFFSFLLFHSITKCKSPTRCDEKKKRKKKTQSLVLISHG
jgi:hypothetical protein